MNPPLGYRRLESSEIIVKGDIFFGNDPPDDPAKFHKALSIGFTPAHNVHGYEYFRSSDGEIGLYYDLIEKVVDGERFQIPIHCLNEFEFWFGFDNPFKTPGYVIRDGKVNQNEDTGLCGNDAIVTRWVPVVVAMQQKCNAIHLGPTEEKRNRQLFGGSKRRGRPRKK